MNNNARNTEIFANFARQSLDEIESTIYKHYDNWPKLFIITSEHSIDLCNHSTEMNTNGVSCLKNRNKKAEKNRHRATIDGLRKWLQSEGAKDDLVDGGLRVVEKKFTLYAR